MNLLLVFAAGLVGFMFAGLHIGSAIYMVGWIGDAIDILSIITTLFGVCTSLGLGVTQLSKGLHRMTCDQDAGCPATGDGSGIVDGLATQICLARQHLDHEVAPAAVDCRLQRLVVD